MTGEICRVIIIKTAGEGSAMRNLVSEILGELRHYSMRAFRRITLGRQAEKLTVSEVFSLYLIDMLNGPTLKVYAEAMAISQPNATYKINALVEKGYVEKIVRCILKDYILKSAYSNI